MNIFILEDDVFQRNRLENLLEYLKIEKGYNIHIVASTENPRQLIDLIKNSSEENLYFLDIQIRDEDKKGMEVAQIIRGIDEKGTIVFVTTHSEFAALTFSYKVSALDFIAKDLDNVNFDKQIEEVIQFVERKNKKDEREMLVINTKFKDIRVPLDEVLYFETSSQPHKLILITSKKRIEFYAKLSDIEGKHPKLIRTHKSFGANIDNAVELDKSNLTINFFNGEQCYVSRRKIKQIQTLIDEK